MVLLSEKEQFFCFYLRKSKFIFLLFFLFDICWAQKSLQLRYHLIPESPILRDLQVPSNIADSATGFQLLKNIILKLHRKGYLMASVDSISWQKDTLFAFVHIGQEFKWMHLQTWNIDDVLLRDVGFHEKLYRGRPFRYDDVSRLEESILQYVDERGYPFASVKLDSVEIKDNSMTARLNYQRGIYIIFDTIRLIGTARLRTQFLENWLRLLPGQPYSQSRLDQAFALLKQQPYLNISRPYEVAFKNDRAYITFYADAGKASEADGIVGFQPNEQQSGRLLLTGELNLRLRNLFNSGGAFNFSWQQIKRASPRLHISYTQPAFLRTPLEVYASFQLLREDSTRSIQNGFLTLNQQVGLFHNLNSWNKIGIGIERRTSRLADSTIRKTSSEAISQQANTNWLGYQVFYTYRHLNDFLYPRWGWWLNANITVGNKQVTDSEQFKSQNILVQASSTQLLYQVMLRRYSPLGRKATLLLQLAGGQIFNTNLFQNDLFRLGGLTSLRGFNENFFFASDYTTFTLEYRFFWESTSYLFIFYDQAWLKTRILHKSVSDIPSGVGAGISFGIKTGVFNIVYALGNSYDRALGLGFSKIHFGLISRF